MQKFDIYSGIGGQKSCISKLIAQIDMCIPNCKYELVHSDQVRLVAKLEVSINAYSLYASMVCEIMRSTDFNSMIELILKPVYVLMPL